MARNDTLLYQRLQDHEGHAVEIARYGTRESGEPLNLSLECTDCGDVICDTDIYDLAALPEDEDRPTLAP